MALPDWLNDVRTVSTIVGGAISAFAIGYTIGQHFAKEADKDAIDEMSKENKMLRADGEAIKQKLVEDDRVRAVVLDQDRSLWGAHTAIRPADYPNRISNARKKF